MCVSIAAIRGGRLAIGAHPGFEFDGSGSLRNNAGVFPFS